MSKPITKIQLDQLELVLDRVFGQLGLDIEFTRHFLDRVNDKRNRYQITLWELAELFKKEYIRWGNHIAGMPNDAEAVMKDLSSDLNIPIAIDVDHYKGEKNVVAKTVMRKPNFRTFDPELTVENVNTAHTPLNREVVVPGVGRYTVDSLQKNIKAKLANLANRAATGDPYEMRRIRALISDDGVLQLMLDALTKEYDMIAKSPQHKSQFSESHKRALNEYKPGVTVLTRELSFNDHPNDPSVSGHDDYETVKRIRWPYGIDVKFNDRTRTVRFKTAKMKTVAKILNKHVDFGAISAGEALDLPSELMIGESNTPSKKKRRITKENYNQNLYYVQPDGTWKKGGDGRSPGRKRDELPKNARIVENAIDQVQSFVRDVRRKGWSVYVSRVSHHTSRAFRLEFEKNEVEFEIIGSSNMWELYRNGPTISGQGEEFSSLQSAFDAAISVTEDQVRAAWNQYRVDERILKPQEAILRTALKILDKKIQNDNKGRHDATGHAYDVLRQVNLDIRPRDLVKIWHEWHNSNQVMESWLDKNLPLLSETLGLT